MKEKWLVLYDEIIESGDEEKMAVLGSMVKRMMSWYIENESDIAQECLDMLEAVRWNNYLTQREAEKILSAMEPKAPWTRDQWKAAMTEFGLELSHEPYYNSCALWVEMNKMYSDFGETIAELLGKPLAPTDKDIIAACYKMALKTLQDKDGVYNIRSYFGL